MGSPDFDTSRLQKCQLKDSRLREKPQPHVVFLRKGLPTKSGTGVARKNPLMKIMARRKQREAGRSAERVEGILASVTQAECGDEAVARMLRRLLGTSTASYLVNATALHRGDVDHVILGRSGVFLIETRGQVGDLGNGNGLDRDPLRQIRRRASNLFQLLRRGGIDLPGVQAAICLPGAALEKPQLCGGVLVARPWQLAYLIRHWQGDVMSDAQAARAFAVLRAHALRDAA
jgi:hypothetical protein